MKRFGTVGVAAAFVLAGSMLAGCASDEPAGPSDRDLLEAIMEGDPSDAEVEAKLTSADLLCGLSPEVLNAIWEDLDPDQFDFQEFVFETRCSRDGTFLLGLKNAEKAAEAAVPTTTTSTTRPKRTTTTRRTTTSLSSSTTSG